MSATDREVALQRPAALFDIAGRSTLVTGATGAFGRAASLALAAAGARVTAAGGNAGKLAELVGEITDRGGSALAVARRPESAADADAMVDAAVEAHGGLDLVVAASGMNHVAPTAEMDPDAWQSVMDANVKGSWLVCRSAGRRMLEQGRGGKIVLVSSTRGRLGHPAGYSAYCPSKGAVDQLTRTLAAEWGPQGITVNAIAPTVFRSPLTAWMYADDERGTAVREAMLARIPLGRLAEPEDFVGALLFMLSPASAFCTGQVLYMDGGYTAC